MAELRVCSTAHRMFPFVTHTPNPLGGECPYKCSYCWARDYKERFSSLRRKYSGPPRLYASELKKRYKEGDFVFAVTMRDPCSPDVTDDMLRALFDWMRQSPKATFLLLTKNPHRFLELRSELPPNLVCGATIESDRSYPKISKAPFQYGRLLNIWQLGTCAPNKRFICVEPVLYFNTARFAGDIIWVKPWAVAVGYDNYGNKLPEPRLRRVFNLLERIAPITTVYVKSLREKATPGGGD